MSLLSKMMKKHEPTMEDPFYFYAENIVQLAAWIDANCKQLGFDVEDVVIASSKRKCGSLYEWCVYVRLPEAE